MRRLLVALLATLVALLLAEGALSLLARRSLRDVLRGRPAWMRAAPPALPPGALGLFRPHPDPRVGYVLRADEDLAIFDGDIRSDALGLRRRPGPSRGPDALRLVVLGDSVAFGYGLDDDETLAHRLELLLDDARAAGDRPVECRTVAIPGWNHRNAVACLLDHLDALDPDLVVYLPISNDLLDSDGVDELSRRRAALDLVGRDPWLMVNQLVGVRYVRNVSEALAAAGRTELGRWLGPDAIRSDLSPESNRRYDANAASIVELVHALRGRGAKLLLLQWLDDDYSWHLRRRLRDLGVSIPLLPLFASMPASLTLGFDPHPSPRTVEGMARWIAADLLRRGWVAGDAARVPPAAEEVEAERAADRPLEEVVADSARIREGAWTRLRSVIDFQTREGVGQIYGGINIDALASARALFLLPRRGPTLTVRLAPIEERPDLYPMEVAVEIDDAPAGSLRLAASGVVEASFAVPARPAPAPPIEVRLIPQRFGVLWTRDIGWHMASFRPLRLQCGPAEEAPGEDAMPPAPR